jgi:hypothetical protein
MLTKKLNFTKQRIFVNNKSVRTSQVTVEVVTVEVVSVEEETPVAERERTTTTLTIPKSRLARRKLRRFPRFLTYPLYR